MHGRRHGFIRRLFLPITLHLGRKNLQEVHFKPANQARRPTFASDKTRAVRAGKVGWEEQAVHTATKGKECNYKRKWAVAGYPGESVKYLLIIEGQASNDGFTGNFDLSYQRALSLYRYFQINRHLDLKRQNCEVLVCGSGTEGALRAYPDNASNTKNQRFLIHILPKPGVIN